MKDPYRKRMQSYVKELKADLDKLMARAERSEAETRIASKKLVDDLKRRFEPVETAFERLQDAGAEAWEDARDALNAAVEKYVGARREAAERGDVPVPPAAESETREKQEAGPSTES